MPIEAPSQLSSCLARSKARSNPVSRFYITDSTDDLGSLPLASSQAKAIKSR